MIKDMYFDEILKEELRKQLPDGYPCDISKEIIIKDIVFIVNQSMRRYRNERSDDGSSV